MLARTEGLSRRLGAVPLRTPVFLGAPLLARLEDCAEHLIFHGSTPWDLDAALEEFGFDLGPCAAQDLRGLDLAYARHRREDALDTRHLSIDPLIEDLAREEAYFAGVTPQPVSDEALRQTLVAALVIEAKRLLASGVPAPLIDLVATQATGFPAAKGGPLFFASCTGSDADDARAQDGWT
jgi:3-hydroxyacyl-CoA dehydrogenase